MTTNDLRALELRLLRLRLTAERLLLATDSTRGPIPADVSAFLRDARRVMASAGVALRSAELRAEWRHGPPR